MAPLIQTGRADHVVGHSQCRQLAVQPEARRSGFIATDDLFGQGRLLPGPHQRIGWLERLRCLRLGSVNHTPHHNARRVDIQRQLDLLVLGWPSRLNGPGFACDLRCAGLSVRTLLVCIHLLVDAAVCLRVRQHSCHLSIQFRVTIKQSHPGKAGDNPIREVYLPHPPVVEIGEVKHMPSAVNRNREDGAERCSIHRVGARTMDVYDPNITDYCALKASA